MNQMWCDSEERTSFVARLTDAPDVRVLDVSDTAVDHPERVGARGTPKVVALDERHGQTTLRRIPCCTRSEDAATDHGQVEVRLR